MSLTYRTYSYIPPFLTASSVDAPAAAGVVGSQMACDLTRQQGEKLCVCVVQPIQILRLDNLASAL
jgi:hypothetical protein